MKLKRKILNFIVLTSIIYSNEYKKAFKEFKKSSIHNLNSNHQLVIGAYSYKNPGLDSKKGGLRIFIESLRKYNPNCCILIFMDKVTPEIKQFLKIQNVTYMTNIRGSNNILYFRFIYTYHIIKYYQEFKEILIADIDDVIFQGDPFSIPLSNTLYLAQETSSYDDKNNSSSCLNMRWIRTSHKSNSFLPNLNYEHYRRQNVVCAGTILGKRKPIVEYLNWLKSEEQACIRLKKSTFFCKCQGLLNIYAYEIKKIPVTPYQIGRILTLDKMDFNSVNKDENGFLLNKNNEKYMILHQIDRCGPENLDYLKKVILNY